jgi:DNA polymerase-3 subunit delta'
MHLDRIVGHTDIIKILKNMVAGDKVPHALLFAGPKGIGKMTVARVLAAGLLCSGSERPCGKCPACEKIARDAHPDMVVVASDGASLKIDQVRELQHEIALAPYEGVRRIFILEEAERMTVQAANSLLKILEEPPAGAVLILTAAASSALLPTIISRCRVFNFRTLPFDVVTNLLVEQGADREQAVVAARLGGGSVGKALALLAPDGFIMRDKALEILEAMTNERSEAGLELAASVEKLDGTEIVDLFGNLSLILRDIIILSFGQEGLVFNLDCVPKLQKIMLNWNTNSLSQAIRYIKEAQRALETNANLRLTCEALFIKLAAL